MPTSGHEGHDPGRPEGTSPHLSSERSAENPGYETQDVRVSGIITFLAGLSLFVFIFFIFCFVMGKGINSVLLSHDQKADKWHDYGSMGETPHGQKRDDLASNASMEQAQLNQMSQAFPTPRLETDDGNQDLADLHAREDLLLENYSTSADLPAGTIRIPIERAMQLVVQRGLPQATATAAPSTLMAGDAKPVVLIPLTSGFARTGYELDTIEARNQKNEYEHAERRKE